MDITDVFGQNENRPDHPDFWKLSEVLLMLDSSVDTKTMSQEECETEFNKRLADIGIDERTAAYTAIQRALRAMTAFPPGMPESFKGLLASVMAGMWLDGFSAGAYYERKP